MNNLITFACILIAFAYSGRRSNLLLGRPDSLHFEGRGWEHSDFNYEKDC